jgi:hypothetical protein
LVSECACCADLLPRSWCVWVDTLTGCDTQQPTLNARPSLLLTVGPRGDPSPTPCEYAHRKGVFRVVNDWTRVYGASGRARSPFCSGQLPRLSATPRWLFTMGQRCVCKSALRVTPAESVILEPYWRERCECSPEGRQNHQSTR